jgi:dTDP-4-dehydrorhamnose reductase
VSTPNQNIAASRFQKILVAGASGQLAQALIATAPPDVEIVALTRADLNVTDEDAVFAAIEKHQPDLVFNGAAYNLVDKAESDGARAAIEINALGVANLARACREAGSTLVHFSTDFVFDGAKKTPYRETDATHPLGIYAASKLAGENITLASSPRNFAIRVCRLFGPTAIDGAASSKKPAGNFPLLMLKLARERGKVRVVNDQIGTPSYTPDLARGVWQLIENAGGGLFHLSNAGEVSFADYARAIFEMAHVECEVEGISSEEYGAPARRPEYSTLDNSKAHAAGVLPLRHWREALREFLETHS